MTSLAGITSTTPTTSVTIHLPNQQDAFDLDAMLKGEFEGVIIDPTPSDITTTTSTTLQTTSTQSADSVTTTTTSTSSQASHAPPAQAGAAELHRTLEAFCQMTNAAGVSPAELAQGVFDPQKMQGTMRKLMSMPGMEQWVEQFMSVPEMAREVEQLMSMPGTEQGVGQWIENLETQVMSMPKLEQQKNILGETVVNWIEKYKHYPLAVRYDVIQFCLDVLQGSENEEKRSPERMILVPTARSADLKVVKVVLDSQMKIRFFQITLPYIQNPSLSRDKVVTIWQQQQTLAATWVKQGEASYEAVPSFSGISERSEWDPFMRELGVKDSLADTMIQHKDWCFRAVMGGVRVLSVREEIFPQIINAMHDTVHTPVDVLKLVQNAVSPALFATLKKEYIAYLNETLFAQGQA